MSQHKIRLETFFAQVVPFPDSMLYLVKGLLVDW